MPKTNPPIIKGICSLCGELVTKRRKTLLCSCRRLRRRLREWGLSAAEQLHWTKRLIEGPCDLCQKPETAVRFGRIKLLALDHDHQTGVIRGVLCQNCNTGLGLFGDDVELLAKAIRYVAGTF